MGYKNVDFDFGVELVKNTMEKLEAEKKAPETDQVSQKKSESVSLSSVSVPKYQNTMHSEEMAILPNKPKYINKYGNLLYKLNKDHVNTLASTKHQEPALRFEQQGPSARLLSKPNSMSRVIMGGVEMGPNTFVRGFNALKNNPSHFMGDNARGYGGHRSQFAYDAPPWENHYDADSDAKMLNFSPHRRY